MDGYGLALFVHLMAVLAAFAAGALMHLAWARYRRAATLAEAREWHAFAARSARVFPAAILTLVASGAYMVASRGVWSWGNGWISAGLTGVVLLLASGAVFGARARRTGQELARLAASAADPRQLELPADPVARALGHVNGGIALGVVFAMTAKPALPASMLALLAGIAAGLAWWLVAQRRGTVVIAPEAVAG